MNLQRFNFIDKHKSNEKIISMYDFWDAIKKTNSSNSQNLYSPLSNQLDLFYICLLVGLKLELKENTNDFECTDITSRWTVGLKDSKASDIIIGLYLNKITKKNFDEKNKINEQLNSILDHNSDTKLSDEGNKELHSYAFGGYKKILEELDFNVPLTLVKFFDTVYRLLK